ncbi:MAG: gfo/Idh/MocA family oxidoreductase, partial [Verrucomicrobia bacterium]|nr:gfo/Idh/MocA family oxidoreductase [Verrucomicrobiota bacterium]
MNKISRRKFLEKSLIAGAGALSAPYILKSASPNETLGVAVVGVRGRGNSHLGAFISDPRTEVRYIVEVDADVASKRAAEVIEK